MKTSFMRDSLGDLINTLKTVMFKCQNTVKKKIATPVSVNYK